jgi:hypothetical protein
VHIQVYNYAMGEPIANATVLLLESRVTGGLFSGSSTCKTIASATTNGNGECTFDNEKLRKDKSYLYACNVSYAYGKDQFYTCGQKYGNAIQVGKTNTQVLNVSSFDAYVRVQINNLLSPSSTVDSLVISINTPKYQAPDQAFPFGGGGVMGGVYTTNSPYYPFPASLLSNIQKTDAGKNSVYIRKRKMGVVTVIYDTIKIQPDQTGIYTINW